MSEIQILSNNIIITAVHITFPDTYTPPPIYDQHSNDETKRIGGAPVNKPFSIKCGDIYFDTRVLPEFTPTISSDKIAPYVMIDFSTSPITMDSETRGGCVKFSQFEIIMLHKITNDIEIGIAEVFNDFHIDVYTAYPDDVTQNKRDMYEQWIHERRFDFYIVLWHLIMLKNNEYLNNNAEDLRVAWVSTFDRNMQYGNIVRAIIKNTQSIMNVVIGDSSVLPRGVKIMPLTLAESANYYDIRYRVWREIYVIRMIIEIYKKEGAYSPYFLNYYTPFKIAHNVDANIFGNPNIIARYNLSDQVIENQQHIDQLISDSYITGTEVDNKLRDFAQTTRELSRSIIQSGECIIAESKAINLVKLFNYHQEKTIKHVINSCAYALIIMHCRFGIIHGDLHLGNIGFYSYINNAYLVYKDKLFYQMMGGCVILDFSRSIINPYHISARQHTQSNLDVVAREQAILIEQLYLRIFPNGKYIDQIRELLRENFELGFKIMSALDMIDILTKLLQVHTNEIIKKYLSRCILDITNNMEISIKHKICDYDDLILSLIEDVKQNILKQNVHHIPFNISPFTINDKN